MQPLVAAYRSTSQREVPRRTSGYRREYRPECCTLPPHCKPSSQSHYSGPRNLKRQKKKKNRFKCDAEQQDFIGRSEICPGFFLTSFCIVAVCGVVPWAEAFTMMHNYSRQIISVASSVDRVTWACAAVWFDVQNLVKGHMDANFLPMVPPRPSAVQQGWVSITRIHMRHTEQKCTLLPATNNNNKQDRVSPAVIKKWSL